MCAEIILFYFFPLNHFSKRDLFRQLISGAYAGAGIQYVIPATLVLLARRRLNALQAATNNTIQNKEQQFIITYPLPDFYFNIRVEVKARPLRQQKIS